MSKPREQMVIVNGRTHMVPVDPQPGNFLAELQAIARRAKRKKGKRR